ncbi:uncharacterized protein LOC102804034, partial [Saccoglossus kowalevskii]|uniref:Uncharacterized ABC transporter ATP-binding protein C825.01-like n=1 Tax=Saccoglossus kowalevskii TaxID=10224 RepID=A0ABM0MWL8_SACKO
MGKPKKGKKAKNEDFNSDEEIDLDPLSKPSTGPEEDDMLAAVAKPSKKGKKNKRKDDNWEDDILNDIESLKIDSGMKSTEPVAEPVKMVKPEPASEIDQLEAFADEMGFEDKKGKKGKKSKKKKQEEELDDLDSLVNEIETPKEETSKKKK